MSTETLILTSDLLREYSGKGILSKECLLSTPIVLVFSLAGTSEINGALEASSTIDVTGD